MVPQGQVRCSPREASLVGLRAMWEKPEADPFVFSKHLTGRSKASATPSCLLLQSFWPPGGRDGGSSAEEKMGGGGAVLFACCSRPTTQKTLAKTWLPVRARENGASSRVAWPDGRVQSREASIMATGSRARWPHRSERRERGNMPKDLGPAPIGHRE